MQKLGNADAKEQTCQAANSRQYNGFAQKQAGQEKRRQSLYGTLNYAE